MIKLYGKPWIKTDKDLKDYPIGSIKKGIYGGSFKKTKFGWISCPDSTFSEYNENYNKKI